MSTGATTSSVGRAKFRKFVTTCPMRVGLVADALHERAELRRQPIEVEQPGVPVDRGQPVAELVRDAGGQLPEPRQAVLQAQLLFQVHDLAQIA